MLRMKAQQPARASRPRNPIFTTETAGLLLIAFLLLMIALLRYWHDIHWSLR